MKHMTQVRVGTYTLTPDLTIGIRASDDGTVVSFNHKPTNLHAIVVINEHGQVIRRSVGDGSELRAKIAKAGNCSTTPMPSGMTSESRIEILDKVLKSVPKRKQKTKVIRFILQYGQTSHRNRPHAITAYTDGVVTHILYQISRDPAQRHLRLEGENVQIEQQIRANERLSPVEWGEITKLPEGTNFAIRGRLGLYWKLKADELRELVAEKTLNAKGRSQGRSSYKIEPAVVPVTIDTCPTGERRKFKTRHVSVLNCEPANFDHADGEPATAITIAHNDSVEPLTIDLATTRKLVVGLLTSLWTADDSVAEEVLEKFPLTDDGDYYWPKDE